jgi:AcrR family transcriptional regulator
MLGHRREFPIIASPECNPRRDAILEAAGELLVTRGLVAVTIDAVARHAHVGTAAVQRMWPTEQALAADVLHHEWAALVLHIRRKACEYGI